VWTLIGVSVGAILGGLAQVLAGWLEHRRSRRSEHVRLKREAYLDFLTEADSLVGRTSVTLMIAKLQAPDYEKAFEAEGLAWRRFHRAHLAVLVYAPPEVVTQADRLAEAVASVRDPSGLSEDWQRLDDEMRIVHDETAKAMRDDLGY